MLTLNQIFKHVTVFKARNAVDENRSLYVAQLIHPNASGHAEGDTPLLALGNFLCDLCNSPNVLEILEKTKKDTEND